MPAYSRNGRSRGNNWELVTYNLSEGELKAFDKWYSDHVDDLDEIVASVLLEGYKLSVSYHVDNSAFIATLTGKDVDTCPNAQRSMSSWDGTLLSAMMMALFKHLEVMHGDKWTASEQTMRRG